MGVPIEDPIPMYCDNMSTIHLSLVLHGRTEHIAVHYHFILERVLVGDIDLWYISMNMQIVDLFMNTLGIDKLR